MENSELIKKALDYIRREFANADMSIEDVADNAGFSISYFNKLFQAHTGFSVMEYVRFRRMKKAAMLLRQTERDILDIALECGYEAHESFTRAFKKQYGRTPSEYREEMKKTEMFFGDVHNETLAARLTHEFPQFRQADRDEAVDLMLDPDALRLAYEAVCMITNGAAVLYDGETPEDGFISFCEWDRCIEGRIFSNDYDIIARYMKIFSDSRFSLCIITADSDEIIKAELEKRGVPIAEIKRGINRVYTGEPYELTAPEGITMRELNPETLDDWFVYAKEDGVHQRMLEIIPREVKHRYDYENEEHSFFQFLMYKDAKVIGWSVGGIYHAHGYAVNNCIETYLLDGYKNEELYRYAFKYVTNKVLERGALPFDDMQCIDYEYKSGSFDSTELGYRSVGDTVRFVR